MRLMAHTEYVIAEQKEESRNIAEYIKADNVYDAQSTLNYNDKNDIRSRCQSNDRISSKTIESMNDVESDDDD